MLEFIKFQAALLPSRGLTEDASAKKAEELEKEYLAISMPWVKGAKKFDPVKYYYDTIARHKETHKEEE
jgi:hypothetical protein